MQHHSHGASLPLPIILVLAAGTGYLALAIRQHRSARRWNRWRTISLLCGAALLMLAFSPQLLPFAQDDFRKHMLQHLLMAMLAPIGLVMAAPMTLLLRTLPSHYGRMITRALRTSWLMLLSTPVLAMVLNLGGMGALYFTPLYTAMMLHPALHALVDLHFVAAGCLYTWVIAGPDPSPHRPSVPARLVLLGLAVVIHSVLAQLLYAGWHVAVPASTAQLQQSAELMYYGGDISEMLLAFALVSTWYPTRPQPHPAWPIPAMRDLPAE